MAYIDAPKPGDPIWVDLYTADPDGAIAFYDELFGWTAERAEEFDGYITFRKNGKAVAGGMGKSDDGPDQWTVYLSAADAAATVDNAVAHGGSVVVPAMLVGDLGAMAVLGDPHGAGVGVWQSGTHRGFETIGIASGGVWSDHIGVPTWFELQTGNYDAAIGFYREVFGWRDTFTVTVPDADEFRYTTIHAETPMLGGVMDAAAFLPPGTPDGWLVYFGADDIDKTAERAVELGGRVLMPPMDTPFGRVAALADPTGARFSIGGNKS
ncbi:VOC family protein [Nocardia arthritidis]|uniref:VOC family protein n=1 Tax=Nocardia arthritidis TaxID=228602 RepID=A0A6G9YP00_9NOCA|nr:VOC family protein [Nocardia arthritidis]QIS14807.1 VOC family protein [Nocardia arthritidis]